jgi:hypothetical protein
MGKYFLSTYEKFLYYHTHCDGLFVLAVGILDPESSLHLSQVKISRATRIMQKRHPFLRGKLIVSDHDPNQVYIDLPEFCENIAEPSVTWRQITARDQLNSELDNLTFDLRVEQLTWRMKLIEIKDIHQMVICLCLPLFLTDGINVSVLIIELVNILNALIGGHDCPELHSDLEVQLNMHDMCNRFGLFTGTRDTKHPKDGSFIIDEQLGDKSQSSGTRSDLFRLNAKATLKLVRRSKSRNLKLTGVINSAILKSLEELYTENGLEFPSRIQCSLPANLRIRYKPNMDFSHIGHHVCLTTMSCDLTEKRGFWELAEYLNSKVEASCSVKTGDLFMLSHDFDELNAFNSTISSKINRNAEIEPILNHCDLTFSNIGKWVWDWNAIKSRTNESKAEQGVLKLRELYHGDTLCLEPCAVSALIFHVNFWMGELQVMLSTNRRVVSERNANRLRELFIQRLSSFCEF